LSRRARLRTGTAGGVWWLITSHPHAARVLPIKLPLRYEKEATVPVSTTNGEVPGLPITSEAGSALAGSCQ